MKEGWTYKKIKDVGTVIGGSTPNTTNKEYWGGVNCWISPAEVHGEHYIFDSLKKITDKAVKERNLKTLPVGTVILSSRAPIGKIAINKVPLYCNQGFKCVVCGDEIYNEFLYWWFYWKKDYLNSLGTGATFPEISKTVVSNIIIPVPPLSEQQRIVSYLDSAFAQIDELKAKAEKQLSEAKALFQKALSKAMEPKEGWENIKLGKFAYMKAGDFVKASDIYKEYKEGLFPCYGGNGLRGYVKTPNQNGDFCLIGRQGALCGCINRAQGIFRTTEHAVIVKPYRTIPVELVFYILLNANLNQYATGAAQPGLSVNNIAESVNINVPPKEQYKHIVYFLESFSANIKSLEANLNKVTSECAALKQSILRQVFE